MKILKIDALIRKPGESDAQFIRRAYPERWYTWGGELCISLGIVPVMVTRATRTSVWINGRRHSRINGNFYPTWREANSAKLARVRKRLKHLSLEASQLRAEVAALIVAAEPIDMEPVQL